MAAPDAMVGNARLRYALAYAALGWHVLPLKGKIPLTPHGQRDATTDAQTIRSWWYCWPEANVGIHLAPSGLCAVDIDPRSGGDRSVLPYDTSGALVAKTGGGGEHLLFRMPPGYVMGQSPGRGIDHKHHGYIVVEPSVHPDTGRVYAWEDWDVLAGERPPLVHAPGSVIRSLDERRAGESFGTQHITEQQIRELRATLATVSPDDYHRWIKVGHALASIKNEGVGFQLWDEWSARGSTYEGHRMADKWNSFRDTHSSFLVIFKDAEEWGGENVMYESPDPELAGEPAVLDLAALDDAVIPEYEWVVEDWIPVGNVTLFAGHGGSGKSSVALLLAVMLAAGMDVLGCERGGERVRVVYLSAEDNAHALSIRVQRICRYLGVAPSAVRDTLVIEDWTETASVLFREDRMNTLSPTHEFAALQQRLARYEAKLIVADNSSLMYAGNENVRPMVQQFVNALRRAAGTCAGLLLLHHLDKASAASGRGETYSGSTGWHNAVRARWSLVDGALSLEKSNYGQPGKTAVVIWDEAARVLRFDGEVMTKSERRDELEAGTAQRVLRCVVKYLGDGGADRILATDENTKRENGNAGLIVAGLLNWRKKDSANAVRGYLAWLLQHGYLDTTVEQRGTRSVEKWITTSKGTAWASE